MANTRNSAPPESERLLAQLSASLKRHLPLASARKRLVVGLSGGRDSVALLHALHELQAGFGYELAACHVHHGISPNADEWLTFCSRFCQRLQVPLTCVAVTVPRDAAEGLEAAARACRYAAFSKLDADCLVLGQHLGDQAETLLFNLLRGGGVHGARGMPESRWLRPGLAVLRPLLAVPRGEIERYLQAHDLAWIDDESNLDVRHSRNFLRHRIIPELRMRFPAVEGRLAAAAGRFAEAAELLDELAVADLGEAPASFPVPVATLAALNEPRARNLLRYLLVRQGVRIPSEARLKEALRQLLEAAADRHPALILGEWRLFRQRREVRLEKTLGKLCDNEIK